MDKSILLGMGLDCKDGHLRITKGKNFRIYGGSEKTHQMMQEKAVKFNERLDKRGKNLDEISSKEFYEIAHRIGLKAPEEDK